MSVSRSSKRGAASLPFNLRPAFDTAFLSAIYVHLEDGHIVLEELEDSESRDRSFVEIMRVTPHKKGMNQMRAWFMGKGHRSCRNGVNLEIPELREAQGFNPRFDAVRWIAHALKWGDDAAA